MLIGVSGTLYSEVENVSRALKEIYGADWLDEAECGDWDALLDVATKNYTRSYVVKGIKTMETLEKLRKRPFFVHIAVDCPIKKRLENCRKELKCENLEDAISRMDLSDYSRMDSLVSVNERALIKVVVHSDVQFDLLKTQLQGQLSPVIDSESTTAPLRPTWDTYFMKLANLAASRANCMKRRVGCVVVRDCRVIATGYNGTPRSMTNCNQGGCPRCNEGEDNSLSACLCLHAEENALLEAGRDRVGPNAILYCDTCPCLTCSVKIVQTGIKEVVYSHSYRMDEQSLRILKDGNVIVRQHKLVDERTIIHVGRQDAAGQK